MISSDRHQVIGLGGSFDHFHAGHAFFLRFAAQHGQKLLVGITSPALTQKKEYVQSIQAWEERATQVWEFLHREGIPHQIFALSDVYGPTLTNPEITALAVTEHTVQGGEVINHARLEKGLSKLPVYVSPMLRDQTGHVISSTRIRAGEIDRQGHVYAQLWQRPVVLDEEQKKFFGQAQGEIIQQPGEYTALRCVVGDVVLETFLEKKWPFSVGIFDRVSHRKPYFSHQIQLIKVQSPTANLAGHISEESLLALRKIFKKILNTKANFLSQPEYLEIKGEEDLLAVTAVLLAPLGAEVYYGQPHQGIILMKVTEELKSSFYERINTEPN
jgi:cytidyltransferase-like protein